MQPARANLPTDFIESGIERCVNEVQFANACDPIDITELGIDI